MEIAKGQIVSFLGIMLSRHKLAVFCYYLLSSGVDKSS